MKYKGFIIIAFIAMVVIQWLVPWQMMTNRQDTLSSGHPYKFRMAPIDPEDPFRGRYLNLRFQDNHLKVAPGTKWKNADIAYTLIGEDQFGFARIAAITRNKPVDRDTNYLKSTVRSVQGVPDEDSLMVYLDFPIDRYYINERMAEPLEKIFNEHIPDTSSLNYALVRIKSGEAVLEEVFIDNRAVPEWYQKLR